VSSIEGTEIVKLVTPAGIVSMPAAKVTLLLNTTAP
jgi:hypothetical protein